MALLVGYAGRVVEVGGISVDDALREWTPLYLNLGLSRSFDAATPVWREFIAGYEAAADPTAWMHGYYLSRAREYPATQYGCFSYHYEAESRTIRFHFGHRGHSRHGPLSEETQPERRDELTRMFADVRHEAPEARFVRGRSWMYNLPSYCRLFPMEYVRTAARVEPELQFMSLWGQFLDREWDLRPGPAGRFLQAMRAASTLEELVRSFPLPVLAPRCSIEHFYRFYAED